MKDDIPEETKVFRLETNSDDLILRLIKNRYPGLSEINANTITKFSSGNTRVAIALASTVKHTDQLAILKDNELFGRLFLQRNSEDKSLLEIGKVCSLVYSFKCQTEPENNQELSSLSHLANMSINQMFKDLQELNRRQLIQQRGDWMALLPHALANRLAKIALEDIILENIFVTFEREGNGRLLLSFSKRLSYLHESEKAKKIAIRWLSSNGILGDLKRLTNLEIGLLKNIAPIVPESVLAAIESTDKNDKSGEFLSRKNQHFFELANLLRLLAYDPELFFRATYLLCKLAVSEKTNENRNSIRSIVEPLFHAKLSGTHASAEQRLEIVKSLVSSDQFKEISLGVKLLQETLKTKYFPGNYLIDFGAKTRDYGYQPKNREEVIQWYVPFINFIEFQIKNGREWAKELLAECYCTDFLSIEEIFNHVEKATERVLELGEWGEGWVALKSLRQLIIDDQTLPPKQLERLKALEQRLSPKSLTERIKTFVFSNRTVSNRVTRALKTENSNGAEKAIHIAQKLGEELGANEDMIDIVLKELGGTIFIKHTGRIFFFGKGLAETSKDPEKVWMILRQHVVKMESAKSRYELFEGFIDQVSKTNPLIAEGILESVFDDPKLNSAFVSLQLHTEILSEAGIQRIKVAIANKYSPIWIYLELGKYWVNKKISDHHLSEIIQLIANNEGGSRVALEIINGCFSQATQREVSEDIVRTGQKIILNYDFKNNENLEGHDNDLGEAIKNCFKGKNNEDNARILCKIIYNAIYSRGYRQEFEFSLRAIASEHPYVFLDEFLGSDGSESGLSRQFFEGNGSNADNPLDEIDESIIIKWCNENPLLRYPRIAHVLTPYRIENTQDTTRLHWTPLTLIILNTAPNVMELLPLLRENFDPKIYNGSISQTMKMYLPLIEELKNHEKQEIVEWAFQEELLLKSKIEEKIRYEEVVNRYRNERFE